MPTRTFGDRLKRERELRDVSLEEITKATKIKIEYLQALESDDWDHLPGRGFNRGYIRSIARYLGMDEENLLAEYSMARAEPERAETPAPRAAVVEKARQNWRRIPTRQVVAVIAAGLLLAGGWFAARKIATALRSSSTHAAPRVAPPPPPPPAPPPVEASIVPMPKPDPDTPAPEKSDLNNATAATPPAYFEMKVEAGKPAHIRVYSDHHLLYTGHISAGDTKRYRARNTFEISSSDSGAVLIELEGQTMPPLGPSGQPGRATFTRRDVGTAAGGVH
ncbi:MAG TPA: helix-turn-helix domain-containing protein [Candidatus Acidoferrales bacterium]|nr:helix-turn-helix domain-containing protein [Candidatus Acidoferrales bacterium]